MFIILNEIIQNGKILNSKPKENLIKSSFYVVEEACKADTRRLFIR